MVRLANRETGLQKGISALQCSNWQVNPIISFAQSQHAVLLEALKWIGLRTGMSTTLTPAQIPLIVSRCSVLS
jgi:hypothetical protein